MIPNISGQPIYSETPSPEKVKNDFSEIIGKLGQEAALEKCRAIVTSQKDGENALVVAKVFYQLFPLEKNVTFEFADKSTLSIPPHVLEAFKKDSELMGSLFEETEGELIQLTGINKEQLLGILKELYPNEPLEKGSQNLAELLAAADYLNVKRLIDSLTTRLQDQIPVKVQDVDRALELNHSIQNLPPKYRNIFSMGIYFGKVLANADPIEREKLIEKYKKMNVTELSFVDSPEVKKFLSSLSEIKSLNTLMLVMIDLDPSDIEHLPKNLLNLYISSCGIKDQHIPFLPQNLERLDLSNNIEITDEGIRKLKLPQLNELILIDCYKLTNTGAALIPQTVTNLDLSNCLNISNGGIALLPKNLKILNLKGCLITDKAITLLPKSLVQLNLTECPNITKKGIDSISPSIKKLYFDNFYLTTSTITKRRREKGL